MEISAALLPDVAGCDVNILVCYSANLTNVQLFGIGFIVYYVTLRVDNG